MTSKDFFGNAKWLTSGNNDVVCFRSEFGAKNVKSAKLAICGLGMFKLRLNDKTPLDDLYGTLSTDFHAVENEYCKKAFGEELDHRIYVTEIDVTDLLEKENCIAVTLAAGWYRCEILMYNHHMISDYGNPKLCFRLVIEHNDGTTTEVLSDPETVKWTKSNIKASYLFEGEYQDYAAFCLDGWTKAGYDMSGWNTPIVVDTIESDFMTTDCPPDRVIREILPKKIGENEKEYLYDCGENITGTPVLTQIGDTSEEITFRVSERLKNGWIEDYTHHGQKSSIITDGKDREYKLHFVWNGFRYIAVSKNAKLEKIEVIHSDVDVNSDFDSDNPTLNWLYETFLRTQLDNMHCGIPSDCPHLEKRGYTGDGELVCESGMMLLDSEKFYRKWIGDIFDCQDRVSGHVQYTAPYTRCGGGPGGWGCAIIEVPYTFWKIFGKTDLLEEAIPKTMKYFEYLDAHSENDLVMTDQPGEWCLGDWCTAEDIAIPAPFVNNYFYVKSIDRMIDSCRLLGKDDLIPALLELRKRKTDAMIAKYYDKSTGDFCEGIQGANCFAVDLGLGDERTLANLVAHYAKEPWYDTGIFGTDILTRVFFEHGYEELAYILLTSHGKYSFGRWMDDGCTTFPEYWTYKRSQNHPMFGAVTRYLFRYLLGINQEKNSGGFGKLVIAPKLVAGLNRAEGHVGTPSGRVGVKFEKKNGNVKFDLEIPAGVEAVLVYNGEHTVKGNCSIVF